MWRHIERRVASRSFGSLRAFMHCPLHLHSGQISFPDFVPWLPFTLCLLQPLQIFPAALLYGAPAGAQVGCSRGWDPNTRHQNNFLFWDLIIFNRIRPGPSGSLYSNEHYCCEQTKEQACITTSSYLHNHGANSLEEEGGFMLFPTFLVLLYEGWLMKMFHLTKGKYGLDILEGKRQYILREKRKWVR